MKLQESHRETQLSVLPVPIMDEMYLKLIRQANLDAMGGRASTTTGANSAAVRRAVCNCTLIWKTPVILPQDPIPL